MASRENQTAPVSASYDWKNAKEFYVKASPRPTYKEIAERFGIPAGSVSRVASEEDWPAMRRQAQELATKESDALEIITKAAANTHVALGIFTASSPTSGHVVIVCPKASVFGLQTARR